MYLTTCGKHRVIFMGWMKFYWIHVGPYFHTVTVPDVSTIRLECMTCVCVWHFHIIDYIGLYGWSLMWPGLGKHIMFNVYFSVPECWGRLSCPLPLIHLVWKKGGGGIDPCLCVMDVESSVWIMNHMAIIIRITNFSDSNSRGIIF